jgi:Spy/CpxP family protein refolding chaperone
MQIFTQGAPMARGLAFGIVVSACAWLSGAAFVQAQHPQQPYAGWETRPVKALSEDEIAGLRAGHGMGFALAAELNGYPGPLHALQNADALGLSREQRQRTETLVAAMKAEAIPIGERLIRQETELDRLFASKTIEPASLDAATSAIGATQGALRAAHLRYHLAMMQVLTPEQVQRYGELRGYGSGHRHGPDHPGGHSKPGE